MTVSSDMGKFSAPYVFYAVILFTLTSLPSLDAGFSIDYGNDTFLMDGEPFRYVSGSAHYFRIPKQYWRDRLRKMRAAGLNAVSTYVEWSQHEPEPGRYDFSGDLDILEFLRIAQEEDLYVLLRPGPYICAERDMGGLPFWLLRNGSDIYLRSSDSRYIEHAERWIVGLLQKVEPFLYGNGGPIILVQVENEYGSYKSCDQEYTSFLRDTFKRIVKDKAVLYTTDGGTTYFLQCGKISGVYATVDFGPGTDVKTAFLAQRIYEPRGPLVNSEYYPGWLTHWGEKMAHTGTFGVLVTLKRMLDMGANVNFYVFHGGTNFGFTAGANGGSDTYQSVITSYDYDAPITEAGDLTTKYYAIKIILEEYLPIPKNITVNTAPKGDYGAINLKPVASLFSPKIRSALGVLHRRVLPKSFEALGQNHGYLLYETSVPFSSLEETLFIKDVHDYANIYINGKLHSTFSRERRSNETVIEDVKHGDTLNIIVENLGRIGYGFYNNDTKGILSDVLLGNTILTSWNMTSFELKDLTPIENCYDMNDTDCYNGQGFVFHMAKFVINSSVNSDGYLLDSYLDVSHLRKGLVFVNGFNLGRYWSTRGPQKTLYVPGVHLKSYPEENTIIVMDEYLKSELTVSFTRNPIFQGYKHLTRLGRSKYDVLE